MALPHSAAGAGAAKVRLILDGQPGLTAVAEAGDGQKLRSSPGTHQVDLAVLDVAMPRMTGLQAARELSRRNPCPRILMLSMYDNEQYFFESLKAGASGYVLKSVATRTSSTHAMLRCEVSLSSIPVS